MKVQNFESQRSKKQSFVANQFEIYDNGKKYFQSYNSIIVMIDKGKVFLDEKYWNYSKTTGKYRNQFLGETTDETKKKIKSGEYTLTDLNNK